MATAAPATERRKAITAAAIYVREDPARHIPSGVPGWFVVDAGKTYPVDHPAVLARPGLFVSSEHSDADLPALAATYHARQAREARQPLPPDKIVVAMVDFTWKAPDNLGNRFTNVKRGERFARNAPIVRWSPPDNFRRLVDLEEIGRIGKRGELLPVRAATKGTP